MVKPQAGLIQLQTLYCKDAPRGPKSDSGTSSPLLHFRHWGRSTPAASSREYSASRTVQYARGHSKLKGNGRHTPARSQLGCKILGLARRAKKRTAPAVNVTTNSGLT